MIIIFLRGGVGLGGIIAIHSKNTSRKNTIFLFSKVLNSYPANFTISTKFDTNHHWVTTGMH